MRISRVENNVAGEVHGEIGSVADGFADADVVYEETFRTQRVQHASLETHGCVAYFEPKEDGTGERLTVRSSTQTPFLTRRALCALYGLPEDEVRVVAGRVGGGFGGKQEMLTEDIVTLAALKLRRPVKLEYTRAEQFYGATTRHPFTIGIKAGARTDGTLTAIQMRVVPNTGAYGNHGPAVMFHSVGESFAVYRAPHKKVDAFSVYTNVVPAGAFETVRVDDRGEVTTAAFRRYRLPQYADVPRTEVHFMETTDAIGPLGAKSMSESPFNPVAPAFANALRDATGIRFTEMPVTRDRVWLALDRNHSARAGKGSEPVPALEDHVQTDTNNAHQADREGVAEPPAQLRHVLEIHAVDGSHECGSKEDRRP
jgi:CO/xanthine dehydrogenase Mo-binding subunit